jgi:hypothetical protein
MRCSMVMELAGTTTNMLMSTMHSSRGLLALKFALKLRSVILVFWLIIEVLSSRNNQQHSHCSLRNNECKATNGHHQFSHSPLEFNESNATHARQSSHCSLNNEGSCEKYSERQSSHCSLNNEGSCEKYSEQQSSHCSLSHILENSELGNLSVMT